ncbi:hypothetical protein [Nocardia tengchongensis]|uniref:hypothetical protein n=1 Tax=Nocardia tengchongensis TaxID=2055889 RepID=UPI0036BAB902
MSTINSKKNDDTLPCRSGFESEHIETAKRVLVDLPLTSANLLRDAGIGDVDWQPLLRATVESMRGTASATSTDKRRFIDSILQYCQDAGHIKSWKFVGKDGRQDYSVELLDDTRVAIEAKGCPDGNNLTIWDRPSWADEFVVWSLCPESLQHNPGKGVWSGISTRLLPKVVAEKKVVDAYIFWDGRCATSLRRCPKSYGVAGALRSTATDYPGQPGQEDWVPPPCIYLFPRTAPVAASNPHPAAHTLKTSRFSRMLLTAFNVPDEEMDSYVHRADIEARGSAKGDTQILVSTVSRCWPDGDERKHVGKWKSVKREN